MRRAPAHASLTLQNVFQAVEHLETDAPARVGRLHHPHVLSEGPVHGRLSVEGREGRGENGRTKERYFGCKKRVNSCGRWSWFGGGSSRTSKGIVRSGGVSRLSYRVACLEYGVPLRLIYAEYILMLLLMLLTTAAAAAGDCC